MGKPRIVRTVSFKPNPMKGFGKGGHKPSKYVGSIHGLLVFSSDVLEDFISGQGLDRGTEFFLSVSLIKFTKHYLADPDFSCPVLSQEKKRVIYFVDAQNLFFSLRTMRCSEEKSFALFKYICALHNSVGVFFYFCPASDVGNTKIISYGLMARLQTLEGITFIEKDIPCNGGNGNSSNIDNLLITDLVRNYYELPGVEGVVLVSGDQGFIYPLRVWSIGEKSGGPKYVEVIASKDAMSGLILKEEGIKKTYNEDLLGTSDNC